MQIHLERIYAKTYNFQKDVFSTDHSVSKNQACFEGITILQCHSMSHMVFQRYQLVELECAIQHDKT